MEKYTDLEQALNDSKLAIITEGITTEKELNKIYTKYKVAPRIQKRFSNYYSNEFLGHSVSEMYILEKERLKEESGSDEESQKSNKSMVISEPDLYYKEDSFNSGETNMCFILGHSGSGKSMMARTLEGDDIDHIELDDLLLIKDHFTMDEVNAYSDMLSAFFNGEGSKYYIGIEERKNIPKEEYEDKLFVDFIKFAMEHAGKHKDKKYIIDGIWIYLYCEDPSIFADYAVFIKGTSFLKSKMRVMKREMQKDLGTLKDRKKMFGREARNYLLDEDKINNYRSYFGDRPETVFREESNSGETIVYELRCIDKCFVDNDADGINAIMKRVETNKELANPEKIRLLNECRLATIDLHMVYGY